MNGRIADPREWIIEYSHPDLSHAGWEPICLQTGEGKRIGERKLRQCGSRLLWWKSGNEVVTIEDKANFFGRDAFYRQEYEDG
jgi:hypothetical protein